MKRTLRERFLAKLPKSRTEHGCWFWQGALRHGYGALSENLLAHRFAYEVTVGAIPDGMCVCHKCDNPVCVNPKHLFLGTYRDNICDSIQKGRFRRNHHYSQAMSWDSRTFMDDVHVRDL